MPLNVSSGCLRRRRSPNADHWPGTPTQDSLRTPNTRKRQRVDYSQLHNRGREPTPTPTATITPNRPRPAALTRVGAQAPRTHTRQPTLDRSGRVQRPSLFLPDRDPILQPSSTIIQVAKPTRKESGIEKRK